ncbi:hypothetical protein ABPG75_000876 [Micractinium tetrahymenae]
MAEFRIEHNVQGVEGLHLAHNMFSERVERSLFHTGGGIGASRGIGARSQSERPVLPLELPRFSDELLQIINAVKDTGLFPELQTPDQGHVRTYQQPRHAAYAYGGPAEPSVLPNYDAVNGEGFGETILGISLGHSCLLVMTPGPYATDELAGTDTVSVLLPRRSVYVLSGPARYPPGWQHGIAGVGVEAAPGAAADVLYRRLAALSSRCTIQLRHLSEAFSMATEQAAPVLRSPCAAALYSGPSAVDAAAEEELQGALELARQEQRAQQRRQWRLQEREQWAQERDLRRAMQLSQTEVAGRSSRQPAGSRGCTRDSRDRSDSGRDRKRGRSSPPAEPEVISLLTDSKGE